MPSPTHPPTDTGAIGAERSVLEGLLARVEAASGPDREIDRELAFSFCSGFVRGRANDGDYAPLLTASLDAALALCERVLPGWRRQLNENAPGSWYAGLLMPGIKRVGLAGYGSNWNMPTPALALLAAMLRALLAQAPSPATTPTGVLETSLIGEGSSGAETALTLKRSSTNPLQVEKED